MQGLGLNDAIKSYQRGVAWRQDHDQRAKEQKRQQQLDAINTESRNAYTQAEQADAERQRREWLKTSRVEGQTDPGPPSLADLDSGTAGDGFKPNPFKPDDTLMLDLHERRRNELLKGGFIEDAVKSEALVQGQRMRMRQSAVEKFRLNKDHAALAAAIYDTIPDGKKVVGAETIEGAPAHQSETIGNWAAVPTKIKFKLSDGSTHSLTPQEVEDFALRLSDPNIAENEARIRLEQAIAAAKGEESRATAREEGRVKVDNMREGSRLKTEELGVEYGFKGSLAGVNNKAAGERARTSANATLGAATIRSGGGTGSGSRADRLQSTKVDSNGYIVGVFANGTSRRLNGTDGKPIRSGEWAKRVDQMVRVLQKDTLASMDKSPAELRKQAEAMVAGEDGASPGGAEPGAKDYSNLWK